MSSKNIEKASYPLGGFPPIIIIDQKSLKTEDDTKTRGFSKDEEKTVASLKEIMEERRTEVKPFIVL